MDTKPFRKIRPTLERARGRLGAGFPGSLRLWEGSVVPSMSM